MKTIDLACGDLIPEDVLTALEDPQIMIAQHAPSIFSVATPSPASTHARSGLDTSREILIT